MVSRAQGEYEQLEKEREDEEAGRKRGAEDGDAVNGDDTRSAKRVKTDVDDDEMEIEMDEEEDDEAEGSGAGGVSLICSNLPPECTEQIMAALFGQ